jgi:two-component system, sensor histidine kinase PhcS
MSEAYTNSREIKRAFLEYDRKAILNNVIVGCLLGAVLMPVGILLDYKVYNYEVTYFLKLRLLCSLLIIFFGGLVITPIGRKHPRKLGVLLAICPAFFISWMINATEGSTSPYYAGLNLVILVVGFVLHWTFIESLIVVGSIILMYVGACTFHNKISMVSLLNNLYFLTLTGVIVVTGSYYHSKTRFREFAFRFQLDKSSKALEASLAQLKENEVQLVHSEKLASLGRMSAGMIHEINNPLNFTTTALFTLRKKGKFLPSEQQKDFAETLKDVEEGVGRVKTIVSDLRVFTRPDSENCDDVVVGEAVTAALRFLNFERKDEVQIEQDLTPNLKIWANKNKLIHILANLLQNSFDALKTKTFTDERPTIRITGREENKVGILTVRDNGPGIPEAHLQKIFDPFFTTKDVGAGMGLGLSICYRLVQETQGKISVKTEVGKFCEFTLEFPTRETKPSIS